VYLPQRSTLAERGHDLHETPPIAVEALLQHATLPQRLWDPSAGPGAIVDVLRAAGREVIGSDLVDYGRPDFFARRDFLLEHRLPESCEGIVFNPPYKLAAQFIAHALELGPLIVCALLRLAFYEAGTGRTQQAAFRRRVLDDHPPARILVFKARLPMMHRVNYTGKKQKKGGQAFAWFIWDRKTGGPTTTERI
jgi:hypothetical protein